MSTNCLWKHYIEIQIQIERKEGCVQDFSVQPETKMAHPNANLALLDLSYTTNTIKLDHPHKYPQRGFALKLNVGLL